MSASICCRLLLILRALVVLSVSVETVQFHDRGGEVFVLVGTVKNMTMHPRSHEGGFIHVYRLKVCAPSYAGSHDQGVLTLCSIQCAEQYPAIAAS